MKQFFLFLLSVGLLFVACKDDDPAPSTSDGKAFRTVIMYMSAENNLSALADPDTSEMVKGTKTLAENCNFIVFLDKAENAVPSLWKFEGGKRILLKEYEADFLNCDPEKMYEIISGVISDYPAQSYALALWGHASGWCIENDSVETTRDNSPRRAYGRDTGNNSRNPNNVGKWINIPTMAKMLKRLNTKFDFIFCDCCNMANAETAYELRDVTDYLVGSPAEIPGYGAPYDLIMQSFFNSNVLSGCQEIVDTYHKDYDGHLPLSIIKMSEMSQLANATRVILQTIEPTADKLLDLNGLMYYDGSRSLNLRCLYDMNDFLLQNAPADEYAQWKQSLDRAVIYKKNAPYWQSNGHVEFTNFTSTDEKYGGISMHVPRKSYDNFSYSKNFNPAYSKMQWYWVVNWDSYGW